MLHLSRSIMANRRLLLFKWLMVLIPPVTVLVAHTLPQHAVGRVAGSVLVGFVALTLSYFFTETMFRVLRRLQAEAIAREQDILTMNAVIRERTYLSRELHDGAAQLVAQLLLRLDTIKGLVETGHRAEAGVELERLHWVADELFEDIGESIAGIRTDVADRGLICALREYVDQFDERHRILVSLQTDEAADRLSPLAEFQLFRLVQEALTNVRKHAGARHVAITLASLGPDRLSVVVADDGQGFEPGRPRDGKARRLGLTTMRERVETLGGEVQVESRPGSGTRVVATVPIDAASRESGRAPRPTPPR